MIEVLTRQALSVGFFTGSTRRQQLFALLPGGTFKGPMYFNLGRFFATDTTTEAFEEIVKATRIDPVPLADLMWEDETCRPLHEHLVRLLTARQASALTNGQDVTQWAVAIARIADLVNETVNRHRYYPPPSPTLLSSLAINGISS